MTAPDRIETGKVQVGDDWPAVLIRGDHALHFAMTLKAYLAGGEGAQVNKLMHRAVLSGLAETLLSANAHNGVEPVMLIRATPAAMTPEVRALVEAAEGYRKAISDFDGTGDMGPKIARVEMWAGKLDAALRATTAKTD